MLIVAQIAGRPRELRSLRDVQRALYDQTTLAKAELLKARKSGQPLPALYDSGVRYATELAEDWQLPSEAIQRGEGDCEDLATWRAAELQLQGVDAVATVVEIRPQLLHIYVTHPDGRREDPSYRLGMGAEDGKVSGWM